MKTKKILAISLLAAFLITTGQRCKFLTPSQSQLLQPVALTWWGTADAPGDVAALIADYRNAHPNISITYRQFRPEEFEDELVNALAEDRGPDVFAIPNTWLEKHRTKLQPLPVSIRMAYQFTQKTLGLKEEVITEIRNTPTITPGQVRNAFLDAVADDVVKDQKVWGLPLAMDVLALFYNRDLLNNAGIPLPPATWGQVQEQVKRTTFQNQDGQLIQSGIALGTATNVEHAFDILSLLMIQNGAQMTENQTATFQSLPRGAVDRTYNPGPEAARFYTDFASASKEVYTWNAEQPNSIDAFAQGKVAMVLGYHRDIARIEAKRAGKLNYGVTKTPQVGEGAGATFADYAVQVVAKKSKHPNEAWDFIQFITTQKAEVEKYLEETKQPTALRALIEDQLKDDMLNPFADQLLTAKTWYRGTDIDAARSAFAELIRSVLAGADVRQSMTIAAQKITQTL